MIRRIIKIDSERCDGCGLCANVCHEGAIEIIDGKAKLVNEQFCDGYGDCLPSCPNSALSYEKRDAAVYQPISSRMAKKKQTVTHIKNWPLKLSIIPSQAPYFDNADLLIAGDCTAFAYLDMHKDFINGKIVTIGCPKLEQDFYEKILEIISLNDVKNITVVRMDVPCCAALEKATHKALVESRKCIPWKIVTINYDGTIVEN